MEIDIVTKRYNTDTQKILVTIREHTKKTLYKVDEVELNNKISDGYIKVRKNKFKTIVDLTGQTFGDWTVIEYLGNKYWECRCSCGKEKRVYNQSLINKRSTSCGHSTKNYGDLTGKTFGKLKVLGYDNEVYKWKCQCSCGKIHYVRGYSLVHGETKSCGHNTTGFKDLTGQTFGEWVVVKYTGNGMWICQCNCGVKKEVDGRSLRNGTTTSCGHNTTGFKDLAGRAFGEWTVLEYNGNRKWHCRCSCGKENIVSTYSLISGKTKSCGHAIGKHIIETRIQKYNEISSCKNRDIEQYSILINKENFEKYLKTFSTKPSVKLLSTVLDTGYSTLIQKIHKYELENIVDICSNTSEKEKELYDYIRSIHNGEIYTNTRDIIKPLELDIYIPEKRVAIEFNGTYWHSSYLKDKNYHKNKTLKCLEKNIRLIHIFEYEMNIPEKRDKIFRLLKHILTNSARVKYARDLDIRKVGLNDEREFLNKYHLQNYAASSLALGLYDKNELIFIGTFGKSRFNKNINELIRLCSKDNINVVGGLGKVLNTAFKTMGNNIITYCDISKFSGESYTKNGFTFEKYTEPNYVWVNINNNEVLTRYQTQKSKLIDKGIGTDEDTEDEIMLNNGYYKVYDSGNAKFHY